MTDVTDDMLINCVVKDGMHFLQSITQHYGTEKGMEMWDVITASLDQEVREKVFLMMLTGEVGRTLLTIKHSNYDDDGEPTVNNVKGIKAIRRATRAGLKEAIYLWDSSKVKLVDIHCNSVEARIQLRYELREINAVSVI